MNAIVAVDKNWGIGYKGDLLTKIPEDLKRFKELTYGKIVVMGRKTYESLPKHLDNRWNIVLSSDPEYHSERGVIHVCTSLTDTIRYLDYIVSISEFTTDDIFIIGGAKVYEDFLPFCKRVHMTYIMRAFEADTWFPRISDSTMWELESMDPPQISKNGELYRYMTYRNRIDHNFFLNV